VHRAPDAASPFNAQSRTKNDHAREKRLAIDHPHRGNNDPDDLRASCAYAAPLSSVRASALARAPGIRVAD
jgi:hypothetical protein